MHEIGKVLVVLGIFLALIGFLLLISDKLPFNFGRLPGDIFYRKDNFTFYFPITTSIILSVIFSFLLYIFSRFFK